jgi:organic hydroperoxide reductase OsmC/OhrA
MQPFPHDYVSTATALKAGPVDLDSDDAPALYAVAPPQFGGLDHHWSPESLLSAALASCFVLTFRSLSRVAYLDWQQMECAVTAVLDRVDGVTRFTKVVTAVVLTVEAGTDVELCQRVLEKAEKECLVANSLHAQRELRTEVKTSGAVEQLRQ